MTPKEIFNTVVTHLYTQKKQAYDNRNNTCAYRTPEGLKCAIGCLIPDDDYDYRMDGIDSQGFYLGGSMEAIVANFPNNIPSYFKDNFDFLFKLQGIHDGAEVDNDIDRNFKMRTLTIELRNFANYYNLYIPEITEQYI